MVIEAQQLDSNIVLILGEFHTEMSYLGAIGSLMAGSVSLKRNKLRCLHYLHKLSCSC